MMASFKTPERQIIGLQTPKTVPKSASQVIKDISKQYTLLAELKQAHSNPRRGVYVQDTSQGHWDGIIFIHSGMYEGGVFRFRMLIPENYPTEIAPRIFFQTSVYHPLIDDTTGELSFGKHFRKWRAKDKLWHLLKYIYHIFYKIDLNAPRNKEAADMLTNDKSAFEAKAKESVAWSADDLKESSATNNRIDCTPPSNPDSEFDFNRTLRAMLDWGDDPPKFAKDIALTFPIDMYSDESDQQPQGLKATLATLIGTASHAGDVRLSDRTCSGWMCVPDKEDNWVDTWVVLSFPNMQIGSVATVSMFENEKEKKKLDQFSCGELLRTFQPRTQEMKMGNQFFVVLESRLLKFQARSTNAVKVWLTALCQSPMSK